MPIPKTGYISPFTAHYPPFTKIHISSHAQILNIHPKHRQNLHQLIRSLTRKLSYRPKVRDSFKNSKAHIDVKRKTVWADGLIWAARGQIYPSVFAESCFSVTNSPQRSIKVAICHPRPVFLVLHNFKPSYSFIVILRTLRR